MILMTILEIFIIVEFFCIIILYTFYYYYYYFVLEISLSFKLFFFSFSVYTFYGLNLMATFNIVSCLFFLSKIYIFSILEKFIAF